MIVVIFSDTTQVPIGISLLSLNKLSLHTASFCCILADKSFVQKTKAGIGVPWIRRIAAEC